MPWNSNYGNLDANQINSALSNTGSNYKVYSGNPVDMRLPGQGGRTTDMTNDERRAYAGMMGGGGEQAQGGGMKGMLGGMMGGGGGGGGFGGGGDIRYQSPPVGETQAQLQERQFTMRRQAQQQKVQNLAGVIGKIFGF